MNTELNMRWLNWGPFVGRFKLEDSIIKRLHKDGKKELRSYHKSLAGHVKVESNVSLGGFTLVHQFCTIGKYAFSGLGTVISQDVTPYTLVAGNHAKAYKINSEGLRRNEFSDDTIKNLEKCFKIFVKSSNPMEEKNKIFNELGISDDEVSYFIKFIKNSQRGFIR